MNSRNDNIAAAELAALVGGHIKSVNEKMIQRSSTGDSIPVDPRQFLTNIGRHQQAQTTNNSAIPANAFVEPPKSRPAGSEVVGTESVHVENLMIPVDGMDMQMRDAIRKYSSPTQTPQQRPTQTPTQPQMIVGAVVPVATEMASSVAILDALQRIEDKLNLIMKRGKIQPRYKKKTS